MTDSTDSVAQQACSACRKQKRKCSREIPVCSLCKKNRRTCEYPVGRASSSALGIDEAIASLSREKRHEQHTPASRNRFPPIFFLDSYTFKRQNYKFEKLEIRMPSDLLEQIGNAQSHVDIFFLTAHASFPIVSKIRSYQQLSEPPEKLGADTTLLFTAMGLHCLPKESTSEHYEATKRCYGYVEARNVISIKLLQASLLIALYEIANGIYPAAYLTVGHRARLGHAMGIHDRKRAPQMISDVGSWTEAEEIRRYWWAVIILDRYVNLGSNNHPFACDDAHLDDLLPMDERSWELGEPSVTQSLAVSLDTFSSSPFGRTCQAAHLLSRVLRHINETASDAKFYYSQAMQIHRTIRAFCVGISHELETTGQASQDSNAQFDLFPAVSICYSAALTLYDMYTCAEDDEIGGVGIPEQLEMQSIALSNIKDICISVHHFAKRIASAIRSGGFLKISPLVSDCLYQTARNYIWYSRGCGNNEDIWQAVDEITQTLNVLGRKWNVANEYVKILACESSGSNNT